MPVYILDIGNKMSVKKKSIHPGQAVAFALQLTFTFIDSKERKQTFVSLSLSLYLSLSIHDTHKLWIAIFYSYNSIIIIILL